MKSITCIYKWNRITHFCLFSLFWCYLPHFCYVILSIDNALNVTACVTHYWRAADGGAHAARQPNRGNSTNSHFLPFGPAAADSFHQAHSMTTFNLNMSKRILVLQFCQQITPWPLILVTACVTHYWRAADRGAHTSAAPSPHPHSHFLPF